jgi:hypothetical protein
MYLKKEDKRERKIERAPFLVLRIPLLPPPIHTSSLHNPHLLSSLLIFSKQKKFQLRLVRKKAKL